MTDLPVPAATESHRWLGAPSRLVLERVVEGEVPDDELPDLLAIIAEATDDLGRASTIGRSVTWQSSIPTRKKHRKHARRLSVTVTTRDGKTTIRIEEPLRTVVAGVYGGLVGGVGGWGVATTIAVTVTAAQPPLVAAGIFGAFLGGSYAVARVVYSMIVRHKNRQLGTLLDRLAHQVARKAR